jgi:oligoribonuclease (3'-5' exoribonuclease)
MTQRQSSKIREIADALVAAGLVSLDEQADALGLSRSTTWSVLKAKHKASGLSAAVIKRMLASSQVPPAVRQKILEYVEEKAAGVYGHNEKQRRRFADQLGLESGNKKRSPPPDRAA